MTRSHATHRNATLRRQRTFRPRSESLEDRLLMSAGDLDASFGNGGSVVISSSAAKDFAYAVEIQPDGKVLVAGGTGNFNSSDRFEVLRLTDTGTPDSSFGTGGWAVPLVGGYVSDMALQRDPITHAPDGRVVLAGTAWVTTGTVTQNDIAIVRLLSNGALDPTFGQGGKVITGISTTSSSGVGAPPFYDSADAVVIQSDGKILVGGQTLNGLTSELDSVLVRYNVDGSLDTSFGQGGMVVTIVDPGFPTTR